MQNLKIQNIKILFILTILLPCLVVGQEKEKEKKADAYSGATQYNNKEEKIKGYISGKVKSSENNKALEFTTISLKNLKNNKLIEGTITDNKGRFFFQDITVGSYELNISFIGFKDTIINIETSDVKPDIKLNKIMLYPNSKVLSEITVQEKGLIYETRIDKIIYNAENDLNETETDATDVLRKAPLLSVDLEGNVSLRGSRNIKFLVNGKASTFFSSDISSALQMIPAEEIKSIEVITSPGAKYEGEGDAGIVNIITKKTLIDGYKATASGSVGSKANRVGTNISLGKGRFGLSANAGFHGTGFGKREGIDTYKRLDWNENGDTNILLRNGVSESSYNGYRGSINAYYDVNAFNSFNTSLSFSGRTKPYIRKDTSEYITFEGIEEITIDSVNKTDRTLNIEWTTDYTKKFARNKNQELTIAFQIGGDINDGDTYIGTPSVLNKNLFNQNDEKVLEETFQIDYIYPFSKSSKNKNINEGNSIDYRKEKRGRGMKSKKSHSQENKVEIGGKIINRNREIVYSDMTNNIYLMSDQFNYKQIVSASYISADLVLPLGLALKTGLRYENTKTEGNWSNSSTNPFSNNYNNLLPSVVFSKSFSPMRSIKLSYNQRITRPSVRQINTNSDRTDNMNISVGNPNLEPTKMTQYELAINSFGKIIQGSFQLYHKYSFNIIESFLEIDANGNSISKFQNIGESKQNGFGFFGSINLKKLSFRSGINIYNYSGRDSELGYTNWTQPILLYNYHISGNYTFKEYWKAETFAFFRSPTQTIQGSQTSWSMMSIGVKRVFKNKRGSLGIRIIEPFNKDKEFRSDLNGDFFKQESLRVMPFRSFTISFKYTIGKLNFKESNKKTNIRNDDIQQNDNTEF